VIDLGLVRQERTGHLQIANRIYQEIIPRELSWEAQMGMTLDPAWYIYPDGRLDMNKLLTDFQQFFREHSDSWRKRFDYEEAAPQLLLQAFLQRIVNGGGRVEREYGLGRKRTDLLVIWPLRPGSGQVCPGGVQRIVIELKLRDGTLEATLAKALPQTWDYADRCGTDEAHLVIFDRRPDKPWDEKVFRREEVFHGHPITVWGM